MKILIAGAGEVGSHLAKLLTREEQEIILVDADAGKLDRLDSNYNLLTVCGSPSSFATLSEARAGNCDLFVAVTPFETDNVVACAVAKSLGARRTVARIDNYEYMLPEHRPFFLAHGVDSVIYPEYFAAREIVTALERNWVRHWFEMLDGSLILVGVKIRANATLAGMQLRDFGQLTRHFHVSAIKRRHDTIIPRGDDTIQADDIIYFMTRPEHLDELRRLCGKEKHSIRKVMIMGGSRIAIRLARMLADTHKVTIIDPSHSQCVSLSEKCPKAEIVCGDARDNDLLIEEGIRSTDAFVALSDSSETNILACLTAKELGVRKTIAEVENIQYIGEAEALNIGTIVNKKLLAAGAIFQLMLDADANNAKCMALADAEVAELVARPDSKVTRARVRDLNLSHDMTIAGLIRNGEGLLVAGDTLIMPGDRVVVFCLSGAIHKIERLFY